MGAYRSFSGSWIDSEKQRDSFDSEADAPSLIASHQPMLGQSLAKSKPSFAYHLPRRRFTRYFTLCVSAILMVFFVYLIRSSHHSESQVRSGLKKPPAPPPAWEQFPFLKRYHGGIRTLIDRKDNVPEYPAASDEEELQLLQEAATAQKQQTDKADAKDRGFAKRQHQGFLTRHERFVPEGRFNDSYEAPVQCYLDEERLIRVPELLAYNGVTKGFPNPVIGSYEVMGLRDDVCFERFGRLGPYGFGYSRKYGGSGAGLEGDREGSELTWGDELEIDYRNVNWAQAQDRCMALNDHRFKPMPQRKNNLFTVMGTSDPLRERVPMETNATASGSHGKNLLPRTVVLLRTWHDYEYDSEDLFYLRALVNELSLAGGGEYIIHFLIHVHDNDLQIWADEETYQRVLDESLPAEFRGMGTLWSERQMSLIYGGVPDSFYRDHPVHGAYRSTYMPVQYFAHQHPEYDFFWNWEMDVRYTGHFYHLFSQVSEWAKQQPRKGLWERNGRFYIPSEHGTWEDFKQMVRVQTEHGTASKSNIYNKLPQDAASKHPLDEQSRKPEQPIWGPLNLTSEGHSVVDPENDPKPPTTYERDNYEWGVGEEADLITFNPLFDPDGTNWLLSEDVTGYNTSKGLPPRRTAIITTSRLSRRLLETMHRETVFKRHHMFSEMWPGSCALHHGYKAVYAPHPVYIDRAWPTSYLAAILNNGRNGAAGGARTSVFSDERQHNFKGTTWYYNAGHGPNLWKRWLGYKVDHDGGEQEELVGEGRMCLPAMLLHPVKGVDMIYEHQMGD